LKGYHALVDKDGRKADPWEGNLAMANIVFTQDLKNWKSLQPELRIVHRELFSLIDFQPQGSNPMPTCHTGCSSA